MRRSRWVAAVMALFLAAVVLAVWVIPTVQGPQIECPQEWSSADCDEAVANVLATTEELTMPITRIVIEECGAWTAYILVLWPAWVASCGLR